MPIPVIKTDERPSWDEYFLGIATAVSVRGDCLRCRVGAVLVRPDHRIASTGYNGSYPGGPSCSRGECPRCTSEVPSGSGYEDCVEVHAEANALLYASWEDCQGSTLYVTREPCSYCSKLIRASGIENVMWINNQELFDLNQQINNISRWKDG